MTASNGSESPIAQLQRWYRSPLGIELAKAENACVHRLLCDTFGYYLLQVGMTEGFSDALSASRIRHRITVSCTPSEASGDPVVLGMVARLPFASDSIDAVVLPHVLDFSSDPRAVLREVERILIPEGRVIVIGFNALSAWGLRSLLRGPRGAAPWCGRFRTPYQVEDWLSVLGFSIEIRELLMFRPPFHHALGSRSAALDDLGRRVLPILGGVYVIRAVKRVATLTPLRPSWKRRFGLLPGRTVEPTTRGTGHA